MKYILFFTIIVLSTSEKIIGQSSSPYLEKNGYQQNFNLLYDTIDQISEYIYYGNSYDLLADYLAGKTDTPDFKHVSDTWFDHGLISKQIYYNHLLVDSLIYQYNDTLITSLIAFNKDKYDDAIFEYQYSNSSITRRNLLDSTADINVYQFDSTGKLINELVYSKGKVSATFKHIKSDTLDAIELTLSSDPDSTIWEQIVIKERIDSSSIGYANLAQYNISCAGQGAVKVLRYDENHNLVNKLFFQNGNLISRAYYNYKIAQGEIYEFFEDELGRNTITRYIIR